MKKLIYIIFTLGLISILAVYFYTNQPHRDIKSECPVSIFRSGFNTRIMSSQDIALNKFLNKTIVVHGKPKILKVNFEGNIFCTFDFFNWSNISETIYLKDVLATMTYLVKFS